MKVDVLCFGVLRELLGTERQPVTLPERTTAAELVLQLRSHSAALVWDRLAVAVNREFAGPERVLSDGDEVALLPPVSGGAR